MEHLPLVSFGAGLAGFAALAVPAAIFFFAVGYGLNAEFGMAFRGNVFAAFSLALVTRVSYFFAEWHRSSHVPPFFFNLYNARVDPDISFDSWFALRDRVAGVLPFFAPCLTRFSGGLVTGAAFFLTGRRQLSAGCTC